jgi:hypothetical protein
VSRRIDCTAEHPWTGEDDAPDLLVAHSEVDEVYDHGWVYECRACGARWLAGGEQVPR